MAAKKRRKPSLDFSLTGLVYIAMMLFMGLAAINSQANLLFGVFGLMLGVLLVSFGTSRSVLRKLRVQRVLPEHAIVGQRTTLQYEFRNEKRFWPSFSVTLGETPAGDAFTRPPQAYLLHAAAGTTAIVPTAVIPKRRGLYPLETFHISTSFPFGFIRRSAMRKQHESLLVYPAIARVEARLLAKCLSAEHAGTKMRPRRGGSDEFYGVKEYRQGDNPRWINWRRSAHAGVMVSNEMTQVAPPRLLVFVDTFLTERTRAEHALVERSIAMAASLISHALEVGLAVGVHAWSDRWADIQPSRGKRHHRDLLTLLARLPLNTSHDLPALLAESRRLLRPGTTAVVLTPRAIERGLGDMVRGQWLIIGASSREAKESFHFPDEVDFGGCMPEEQTPK